MTSTNLFTRLLLLYIFLAYLIIVVHFDVFEWGPIPILTPLSDHLATILSPFTTCLGPFQLLSAIRYSTHPKWRRNWRSRLLVFVVVMVYSNRALLAYATIHGERIGLREYLSRGEWWKLPVEAALLVLVVVGESMGARWDRGYIDGWLDRAYEKMREREEEKRLKKEARDLEKSGMAR